MHIGLRAVKATSGVVCGQVSTNYPRGRFISEAVFMRCHFHISPYVLIERVFIHDHRSALYTTGLMTKRTVYDTVNSTKKDKRSGKERLCCRYIQTKSKNHIACLIFRGQLRRPPKTRNGLFVYAFIKLDQVDVWDQRSPRETRYNQIDYSN